MGKKSTLWVGLVGLVAVAGGGIYYWLESNKIDEEFLAVLKARGVSYDNIEKDSAGALNFIGAKLNVGQSAPVALGGLTAIKQETGYDLAIEQLEIAFDVANIKLAFPHIEIKAWEFANKIDTTENGLPTAGFLAPLLHDKAASIRLENSQMSSDFAFASANISAGFTIGETMLEGIDNGKIKTYTDKDTVIAVMLDSEDDALSSMVGELITAKVVRSQLQDFNLKRTLEFVALAANDADAPFEQIYSAYEAEDYQISQFDGTQTHYKKTGMSAGFMRGAKKTPVAFIQDLVAMGDLINAGDIDWENETRPLTLIEDSVALLKMVGEQTSFIEGISQTQNVPEIGQVQVDIARATTHLKTDSISFGYQDMKFTSDVIEFTIGAIELEDFGHIRLINGVHELFKTVFDMNGKVKLLDEESAERLKVSSLGLVPRFGKFSIENFHLAGSENFPFKDFIGEWGFEKIALTNEYSFDTALFPTAATLEIKDFAIPAHVYGMMASSDPIMPPPELVACLFDGKDAFISSLTLKAEWDRETQSLNFSDNLYHSNIAGHVDLSVQLGNVPEEFFSFNPPMDEKALEKISLKSLNLSYDPQGNDKVLFSCAAEDMGVSEQVLRSITAMEVQTEIASDEDLERQLQPLRQVLVDFIQKGGKLDLSLKAKDAAGMPLDRLGYFYPFDLFEISLQRLP